MKKLFAKEVFIRLAEDDSAFVCTTKYGKFFSKAAEFALNSQSVPAPEPIEVEVPVPLKRRSFLGL